MSNWTKSIEEVFATKNSGNFTTIDNSSTEVIIEWEKVDPQSSKLSEKINSVSDLLVPVYAHIELQFAKKYPEAVPNEMFLQQLAPMFQEGVEKVNWQIVENKIKDVLNQFFTTTDWTKYSGTNDINFFITAKDKKTGEKLGMIQFLITNDFADGDIKIGLYDGIVPDKKNHNLEKLLIGTIFKLIPTTRRLFLHTRTTNENGINAHRALGFTEFPSDLPNWINLEYIAKNSNVLQNS